MQQTADRAPLEAVEAIIRLGGICATRDLVALSSRSRLRTALRHGTIVRLGRDRLALPESARGLQAARAVNGYASHLTAALHHEWKVKFPPDLPQVTLPRQRRPPEDPGVLVEIFLRDLPQGDRDGWATSKLRTVIDCARDLPFDVALCVADSALRSGDVTQDDLVAAAAAVTGPAAERVRRVAAYADGRAANPFESVLRALAIVAGLPCIPQWAVTCGDVELHPDLANPLRGIALEADSYEFHGREPKDHNRDCSRYNALTVAGWAVLRFTWEQVMHSPEYVVRTIRTWLALDDAA
jgi:hypothetical protein